MLLASKALELSAEAALTAGGYVSEADLGQLVTPSAPICHVCISNLLTYYKLLTSCLTLLNQFSACFPPSSDFVPETLAEIVSRLGQLISAADGAVLRSAQRAVSTAVKALKVLPLYFLPLHLPLATLPGVHFVVPLSNCFGPRAGW